MLRRRQLCQITRMVVPDYTLWMGVHWRIQRILNKFLKLWSTRYSQTFNYRCQLCSRVALKGAERLLSYSRIPRIFYYPSLLHNSCRLSVWHSQHLSTTFHTGWLLPLHKYYEDDWSFLSIFLIEREINTLKRKFAAASSHPRPKGWVNIFRIFEKIKYPWVEETKGSP